MALFKCKMCGGSLEVNNNETVITCEYCGTQQTLPTAQDENLQSLFNRANVLRMKSEFDKAEQIYEKIIQADDAQSEAYWGLILCKYGIEYVEDPVTYKRVPTCHRTSFDSIVADDDYKSALEHADATQRAVYEAEAKEIDRLQKEILALSQKEEPYDVFICYKESDENGKRTQDSAIANDIYYQLTQEGFKVFYAAITLEDKLGSAYEPCIFAALNSAKVMLAIGTKPEYFNAVWVKNEWSRFLKIMKKDRSKVLIPCYLNMDAYELPEEFAHLQAQDMSKIGFINDVVRGIKKVLNVNEPASTAVKETVSSGNANVDSLVKRMFISLEDGENQTAADCCDKILDIDPENAEAYLGKLMLELKVKQKEDLKNLSTPFDDKNNYQRAIRYANEGLKAELEGSVNFIVERNLNAAYKEAVDIMDNAKTEQEYKVAKEKFSKIIHFKDSGERVERCKELAEEARLTDLYEKAISAMKNAKTENSFKDAAARFEAIKHYRDSEELTHQCEELAHQCEELAQQCLAKSREVKLDIRYNEACENAESSVVSKIESAIRVFESLSGWKDSAEQIENCKKRIADIKAKEDAERKEGKEKALEMERAKERRKKIIALSAVVVVLLFSLWAVIKTKSNNEREQKIMANFVGKEMTCISTFDLNFNASSEVGFKEYDVYKYRFNENNKCVVTAIMETNYNKKAEEHGMTDKKVREVDNYDYSVTITLFGRIDLHVEESKYPYQVIVNENDIPMYFKYGDMVYK